MNTNELPVNDPKILQMRTLQPFAVDWQDQDDKQHSALFFLDFYAEKVYDVNFSDMTKRSIGSLLLEIMVNKKNESINSSLPSHLMEDVFKKKQQIMKETAHAREDRTQY